MDVKFDEWLTPDGKKITVEEAGVSSGSKSVSVRYYLRLVGFVLLLVALVVFPIAQFFIPRDYMGKSVPDTVAADVVEYSTVTPSPTAFNVLDLLTPAPTGTASTPLPDLVSIWSPVNDAYVYLYPDLSSDVVGFFLSRSLVEVLGRWVDGWFSVPGGWIYAPDLDISNLDLVPFVSPDMMPVPSPTMFISTPTPAPSPTLTPVPIVYPTPTPAPFFQFQPLPDGFSPGWCVRVEVASVWLPDGSVYYASGGSVYLSAGVLGLPVVVSSGDWYQDFTFSECGFYR